MRAVLSIQRYQNNDCLITTTLFTVVSMSISSSDYVNVSQLTRYAHMHPQSSTIVRSLGGLPDNDGNGSQSLDITVNCLKIIP